MITGFEKYTAELSKNEAEVLAPVIFTELVKAFFQDKILSNSEIRSRAKEKGHKITPSRFRKIIRDIRVRKSYKLEDGREMILIANHKGTFFSTDMNDVKLWVQSVRERTYAMVHTVLSIEKQIKKIEKNGNLRSAANRNIQHKV